jgi:glycosyltransferase involved in cell wall biosynthesis
MQNSNIIIDVYGPGSIDSLGLRTQNIMYKGQIPFGEAQVTMASYDLALVPSRYDGWGVVVNEAILAGTPVICSDEVGAGILVDKFSCGARFKSEDIIGLADLLVRLEKDPIFLNFLRAKTVIAMEHITPKVAATYMLQVINAQYSEKAKISSPWYVYEV